MGEGEGSGKVSFLVTENIDIIELINTSKASRKIH